MPRVFLNYRTGDGEFAASLLDLALTAEFGAANVFLASRTIPPGSDFERAIIEDLSACAVVLAVIGRNWLAASDSDGRRCLDLEEDWVRRELREALAKGIRVIPVLLDHQPRLNAEHLPVDIAAMAKGQYLRLRHRHAADDLNRIVSELRAADQRLLPVVAEDLRGYLESLAGAMASTQSWMPYSGMDSAYLDRALTVCGSTLPRPPDGVLYPDSNPLRYGKIGWQQAIRDVPIGVVLADAGYGKTWLLRWHCRQLCKAALASLDAGEQVTEIEIPLYVHAHQLAVSWSAGDTDPATAVVRAATGALVHGSRDAARLRAFLADRLRPEHTSVHLLIDALDEVFDDQLRDSASAAIAWIAGIARSASGPRILLTSRHAGFIDPFGPADDDQPEPVYFELGVLDESQVRALWRRWFEQRGGPVPLHRLRAALALGSAIRMAVRIPLIAAFAAWVAESDSVAPNRSGLYGQVLDRFLGLHWKAGSPAPFASLRQDPALRMRFKHAFCDLAWAMATGSRAWQDAVSPDECEALLAPALTGVTGSRSHTYDALRGFGLLVSLGGADWDVSATVAWIHRSVHQFLVAQRLITLGAPAVTALVDERCWYRPEWADVLDFAIGLEAVAEPATRFVTEAVRCQALGGQDGLGWFATVFTSASAGLPPEAGERLAVMRQVWQLFRAGLLTASQLVRVTALTPEAKQAELADLVLGAADPTSPRRDAWQALAWCGAAGLAALHGVVARSPIADGAAYELFQVSRAEAVLAMGERLRAELAVHPWDAVVLRALPAADITWLRTAYRRRQSSVRLARCLGWTLDGDAKADLMAGLRSADAGVRGASVCGLVAGFAIELDEPSCAELLEVALNDASPDVRLLARDELLGIGSYVPWVRARMDQQHPRLFRDLPGRIEDFESIVERLEQPGPGTDLALEMIRVEPGLLIGRARKAMADLTLLAIDGRLTEDQTAQVAAIVGPDFLDLAGGRLDGTVPLQRERLRTLVAGLCRAAPLDGRVFDAVVDCIRWNPDPALAIALRLHELPAADKVSRLLARLLALPLLERPAVQVWAEALGEILLEIPAAKRALLRSRCAAATDHLVKLIAW